MHCLKASAAILLAVVLQANLYAGSLRRIWELSLSKTVDAPADQKTKGVPVYAIRFSPDGKQIAVALTWYLPGGSFVSNLVVVRTERPTDNIRKFAIHGIADDSRPGSLPAITWSPSGDAVTAGATVIRLVQGKTCELTDDRKYGFVSSDRIVGPVLPIGSETTTEGIGPTKFGIFDEDCQLRDTWELAQGIGVEDIFADRELLYGRVTGFPRAMEAVVIDAIAKNIVRRSPFWGGDSRFANRGEAICSGRWPNQPLARPPEKSPVRCFDVATGMTIAEASNINDGQPIFAAESTSRIVAHDVVPVRVPFTGGEYGTILKRRVVWDFQTNTEIASWAPPTQTYDFYLGTDPPERIKEPYRVAISPDGEYIVEGGQGILRMYKIEPKR